ncbi:hypothetical protein B0T19DRAFT_64365 [Cercophora scortea]|uniref:Uncharacterized protein n=1 Tax=Cercophora scortea TaxID=314031 RepID=A0AAE0MM38_9PEZI|nr:hypothetical protein B0T19DRAFT_64365 [Cercophora scortea]
MKRDWMPVWNERTGKSLKNGAVGFEVLAGRRSLKNDSIRMQTSPAAAALQVDSKAGRVEGGVGCIRGPPIGEQLPCTSALVLQCDSRGDPVFSRLGLCTLPWHPSLGFRFNTSLHRCDRLCGSCRRGEMLRACHTQLTDGPQSIASKHHPAPKKPKGCVWYMLDYVRVQLAISFHLLPCATPMSLPERQIKAGDGEFHDLGKIRTRNVGQPNNLTLLERPAARLGRRMPTPVWCRCCCGCGCCASDWMNRTRAAAYIHYMIAR